MAKLKNKDIAQIKRMKSDFVKRHSTPEKLAKIEKMKSDFTQRHTMTESEKRNFNTGKWLAGDPTGGLKDSKIRDDAQKEINKKTALDNYFETGELKRKERHEGKGRWVTMKGRRVFIEDGENPTDALKKSLAWEKKNKRRSSGGNKDWNK